jgi:hypothetical protein
MIIRITVLKNIITHSLLAVPATEKFHMRRALSCNTNARCENGATYLTSVCVTVYHQIQHCRYKDYWYSEKIKLVCTVYARSKEASLRIRQLDTNTYTVYLFDININIKCNIILKINVVCYSHTREPSQAQYARNELISSIEHFRQVTTNFA